MMDQGRGTAEAETGEESGYERSAPREAMFLQAELRIGRASPPCAIRVRNLSAGGLMADAPCPLRRGQAVTISLRGVGDRTGHVAWARSGRFGVAFDWPMNPALVREAIMARGSRPIILDPYKDHSRDHKRPSLRVR